MQNAVDYGFVVSQIRHWLSTPANGYLGSDYGIDLKQYLHKPMSRFDADGIIAKMRADIPVLDIIDSESIDVLIVDDGNDGKQILIRVADKIIRAL